ncbi:MAG: efflux RND transporter periplasmic adaptor subunit [Rikenellaceae bacterium]
MDKRVKRVLIGAIVLGGVAVAYYSHQPRANEEITDRSIKEVTDAAAAKPKGDKGKSKVLNVNGVVIKPQTIVDEFNTTGVLLPDEMVDLSFETQGKVVEINFKEGTEVKKGELLARINDSKLQAQRDRLTAQLKLASDRVYRQKTLLERDAVSREALEQVETDLAMLRADIDNIDAQIELTRLHAPFDGVIGLRQISLGQFANYQTVVAQLTKNTPLKVEFAIPERYANHIGKGTNLTFSVEGELDDFDAQVYAAESAVDRDLHQFSMRALYPNRDGRLMPGRYVLVKLKKDEIHDAISIPTHAIVPEMGVDKVFLYRSGVATPVEILTGVRTASNVQVLKGLSLGDTIIISGTLQLRTGLKVSLDNIY